MIITRKMLLLLVFALLDLSCGQNFLPIDYQQLYTKITEELESRNESIDDMTLLQMFDAGSKFPTGLDGGNFFDLGHFDECYKMQSENIYGKYCLGNVPIDSLQQQIAVPSNKRIRAPKMVQIHPQPRLAGLGPEYMGLHVAVCVPSFFKAEDVPGEANFTEDFCYSKDTKPDLDAGAIATIVILSVFGAIAAASTIFDIYLHYKEQTSPHELLLAFSFLTNGRKVFASTTNPDQLLCLNGIKAISMMWVIIGHEYSLAPNGPLTNLFDVLDWEDELGSMWIQGATVAVDTFFAVGGLVTVYTFLKSMDKGVKFNIVLYYIHRYLRLTPALGVAVLVYKYLVIYLGDGPLWRVVDVVLVQPCEDSWWATLLYISNYVVHENCVNPTWYLTVDMQLFILSPLILIPLAKWPKKTLSALGFLIVAGVIVPFAVAYGYGFGNMTSDPDGYMLKYYTQTHGRFGPYVMGMTLGYFVYKIKKTGWKPRIPPKQVAGIVIATWCASLVGLVACVFAGFDIFTADFPERWSNSLYIAFNRPAWALCVCAIIFLCVAGYGGFIDWFLSLPVFQLLTKLSYSMYLVHYAVVTMRYSSMRNGMTFSNQSIMHSFWGDFMLTIVLSLLLCLTFESPVIILEKYIFGRGAPRQKDKKPEV